MTAKDGDGAIEDEGGGVGGGGTPPVILEGVGWKRRSGFGMYSSTLGGSSWERRRFALTPSRLSYFKLDPPPPSASRDQAPTPAPPPSSSSSATPSDEPPRGTLQILPERATITATYPGDGTQPTPYALTVRAADAISGTEVAKWKLCFDDRESQLLWLVALTDIVAAASVREYNAKILTAEENKVEHGGFHRLYEEGDGMLLDLVHGALLAGSSGRWKRREKGHGGLEGYETVWHSKAGAGGSEGEDEGGVMIVHTQSHDATIGDSTVESNSTRETGATQSPKPSGPSESSGPFFGGWEGRKEEPVPVDRLYRALAVVALSFVLERCAETSSSLLWQIANLIVLAICFAPTTKPRKEKEDGDGSKAAVSKSEAGTLVTDPTGRKVPIHDNVREATQNLSTTKSAVGVQLMKAESVPLSEVPSQKPLVEKPVNEGGEADCRLGPLTEDEMADASSHERWAVSAPDVDLSGEWTLIADDTFKQEYDLYLKQLGFSGITRKVACSLIARTTEVTRQDANGRELYLKGTNPKGAWERTLTASGYPDFGTHAEQNEGDDYAHAKSIIKTADAEDVDAEAWWEDGGTKHRSWLRGGKKYGGGDFESLRYLEDGSDGNVLACDSIFHPNDTKKKAVVTWRFQRDAADQ